MVKRKLLEKMSNEELLKYVRHDSQFVYQAIEIAFEILKKRGYIFSTDENDTIKNLIQLKKDKESAFSKINEWDINARDENSFIAFFSQKAVWFFSVFFGVFIGSILLATNLFQVNKKNKAWLTVLFGISYSIIAYQIFNLAEVYLVDYSILILIFMIGIGASILQFWFWDKYLKDIEYRKRNINTVLVLCVVMYILLALVLINY